MPAIIICESCDNAYWADSGHGCGAEHDRLEAQYEAMKAKRHAEDNVELVERCKQLKWLAGNILHHGPDLPSRKHWSCLYRLAEQAEKLAKDTLNKWKSTPTPDRSGEAGETAKHGSTEGESGLPEGSS